jgi:ammonium transporter, Amt family
MLELPIPVVSAAIHGASEPTFAVVNAQIAGAAGAPVIGILGGVVCLFASKSLKRKPGYDDSLDDFGVRGVGGYVRTLGLGILGSAAWGGT